MTRHVILFLAANPDTTNPLRIGEQCAAIQRELKMAPHRGDFDFESRWAVSIDELIRHLNELSPTVIHFSGHGRGKRGLLLQGEQGQPQRVSAKALRMIVDAAAQGVRLVVLNACYTTVQAKVLRASVDCVVGMDGAIGDDAALAFAIRFYGALGNRRSIGIAVDQGVAALAAKQLPDELLPRCVTRDGIDKYQVFLGAPSLGPTTQEPQAPAPVHPSAEVRGLSEQLRDARARKRTLGDAGIATNEINQEIRSLIRQQSEGGQLRVGDTLSAGRYVLIKLLGRGGYAAVWEAHDRTENRRVAIKVLHSHLAGDLQRRERFFRGARAMAELKHQAVVRVLAFRGKDEAFCYFVMELVSGGTLRDAVLGKRLDVPRLLLLVLQVGEALAEAHQRHFIHRDIKPSNILLDEYDQAKLTDFDLVRTPDRTGGTHTGVVGTVVYAAPECFDKSHEATAQADVFGLGMTAIFCLSGQELTLATFRHPRVTLAGLACPPHLRKVLAKSVAWEADRRFANAATMVAALRAALDGPLWAAESGEDRCGRWAVFEVHGVRQRMRWIPPGQFVMGSPETELGRSEDHETPQHRAVLSSGYWLGETPVTQALWVAVMGENPSLFRGEDPDDMERPVESVSWNECNMFVERLNNLIAGLAARLPTEAEWEKGCRAETTGATWIGELSNENIAPELDAIAWYGGNSSGKTHPVGRKASNPHGLHDMLGNVWEWCQDAADDHAPPRTSTSAVDPVSPSRGWSRRICRGGAWSSIAWYLRAAFRCANHRGDSSGSLGFRLAADQELAHAQTPGEDQH